MKRVLLVVTASVACYKAAELTRRLRAAGVAVQVLMTPAAMRLVGAATFRALSGAPVLTDEWTAAQAADGMDHIAAVRAADAVLVAPASADFIAKAAAGIADNLALTAFLATAADTPKIIAPAMNTQMWAATATQKNIRTLLADGVRILAPTAGEQACGETGEGRMQEPADILTALLPKKTAFSGKTIVVSSGATVEYLDAMRFISNRSSGTMGFCLAQAAAAAGAEVRLLAGVTTATPPAGIAMRRAVSGAEMRAAVLEEVARADWFFSVAAVADFMPGDGGGGDGGNRRKPAREDGEWTLRLQPTADILAETRQAYPQVSYLGFAAQAEEAAAAALAAAKAKRQRKGIQFLALNHIRDAGSDTCQLTLLYNGGETPLPRLPKAQAAQRLLDCLADVSYETGKE